MATLVLATPWRLPSARRQFIWIWRRKKTDGCGVPWRDSVQVAVGLRFDCRAWPM